VSRRYLILDVFTREPLAGNPLAVVLDAQGLDTDAMQRIAREFNLSETVFVLPPERAAHRARIRIFTPDFEMPFAGHPTVGSAVALSEPRPDVPEILVLEENVGPVRCVVSIRDDSTFAEFASPMLARPVPLSATPEAVAAALGLEPADVCFENHRPSAWMAGVPYVAVPVSGLDALRRATMDVPAWIDLAGETSAERAAAAYLYCRSPGGFRTRMLAGHIGLVEDPATGSAAAAFAGAIFHFDTPPDGVHRVEITQGVEMGRPSQIRLELDVAHGTVTGARIGGWAVVTAKGELLI
jgi:trans-2,3-dihydro-3-hydroxyanthranilate isomerase